MISWITDARSSVRWSGPASPTVSHRVGDRDTELDVVLLDEMFAVADVNAAASSDASPRIVNDVGSESISST